MEYYINKEITDSYIGVCFEMLDAFTGVWSKELMESTYFFTCKSCRHYVKKLICF